MDERARVGVAAARLVNPFEERMAAQLEKCLGPEQELVKCSVGAPELETARLQRLLRGGLTALIGISIRPEQGVIEQFKAVGVPVILIDEEAPGASSVATDNFAGGSIACDYLIRKGKKRIVVVSGKMNRKGDQNAVKRLDGVRASMSRNSISLSPNSIIEVLEYSYRDGVEAMKQILARNRGTNAVFSAAGDHCAAGLLTTLRVHNVRVPDEMAIIGFDDVEIATTSALTTIRQPLERIAEAAFEMATKDREQILKEPRTALFEPELIVRESA